MAKTVPEDLIQEVARADAARRASLGHPPAHFFPSQRVWIEPIFNVFGRLWGALLFLMPWDFRQWYVQMVIRKMGGHPPDPNPAMKPKIDALIHQARELQKKTGQWPALMVATSHPETEGEWQWLRFEVMAQGIALANAFVEARQPGKVFYSHPRVLLAIDPFALDTVSVIVAGIYAGWMHQIYLAYDRQAATQSWIQRAVLLRNTSYAHIAWRLFRFLKSDVPILMAFGGGLPYNARLLYGAREYVHHLQIAQWKITKRAAQLELLKILLRPEGDIWPAATGALSPTKRGEVSAALARWGVDPAQMEHSLHEFTEEFRHQVPCRTRLLRILHARIVERGKPLIIMPITHNSKVPHVLIGDPIVVDHAWDFRPICEKLANIFDPSTSKV